MVVSSKRGVGGGGGEGGRGGKFTEKFLNARRNAAPLESRTGAKLGLKAGQDGGKVSSLSGEWVGRPGGGNGTEADDGMPSGVL